MDTGPVIDFHVHAFYSKDRILNEMKKAGVDLAVLLAVDVDPMDVEIPEIKEKLRKRHLESFFYLSSFRVGSVEEEIKNFFYALISYYPELKTTNQEIADLVKSNPDKFVGFGSVNPNKSEEYVENKLKEVSALGLKGIKMLPTLQLFSPTENENFRKICEYCEKNKLPILYHTGCDPGPWENPIISQDANPILLEQILERYQITIILAHAGAYSAYRPGIWLNEALELAEKFENVYFDSSAVSSIIFSKKVLDRIREKIGMERLLFGSDFPVVSGSSMKYEVDFIRSCKYLSEEEKEKILGLNAAKLLGIQRKT